MSDLKERLEFLKKQIKLSELLDKYYNKYYSLFSDMRAYIMYTIVDYSDDKENFDKAILKLKTMLKTKILEINQELIMDLDLCFYCNNPNATILKPVPIYKETFFQRMSYQWVCNDCNKKHCEHLGKIENE